MLAIEFDAAEDLDLVHDHLERKGYELEVQIAPQKRILVHDVDEAQDLGPDTVGYAAAYGGTVIPDTELDRQ